MPVERFFIPSNFVVGQEIMMEGTEFHHMAHVMRIKEEEQIELVNGLGALANAVVKRLEKKRALLYFTDVYEEPPPRLEIILAQAMPRLNRLDFILEKGTELGMTQLWLFPGKLSDKKAITDSQFERLEAISIAAMKQCGRLYLPKILLKPSLQQWENIQQPAFFGDLNPQAPSFSLLWKQMPLQSSVLFFIGPESGFTVEEIEFLHRHAKGVKLHPNILRTDTASLVALSLIFQKMIDDAP